MITPNLLDRVFEGDCLEVMQQLPDQSIDLILSDLPYGTTQNPWDNPIDFDRLWAVYKRIIKPAGVIALTAHGSFTGKLIMSNPEWYRYKIVWIKSKAPNFLQVNQQPLKKHEDICIFYPAKPTYHPQLTPAPPYNRGVRSNKLTGSYGRYKPNAGVNPGFRYPTDLLFYEDHDDWVYCKTAETEGQSIHPCQKPVALGRYLIRTYSNANDIVLDNACGTGAFLVAAKLEKRRFIGIEKNAAGFMLKKNPVDFIRICNERLAAIAD